MMMSIHCRPAAVSTGSQPIALGVDGQGAQFVATNSEIQIIQDKKKVSSIPISYDPQSIAVSSQNILAVGGPVCPPHLRWRSELIVEA